MENLDVTTLYTALLNGIAQAIEQAITQIAQALILDCIELAFILCLLLYILGALLVAFNALTCTPLAEVYEADWDAGWDAGVRQRFWDALLQDCERTRER
jgi:hypothetical protein